MLDSKAVRVSVLVTVVVLVVSEVLVTPAAAQVHGDAPPSTTQPALPADLPEDPDARLAAVTKVVADRLDLYRQNTGFPAATLAFSLPDGRVQSIAVGDGATPIARRISPDAKVFPGGMETMFLAIIALDLVEADRLSLDLPISTWLSDQPWFARLPAADAITFRMLLSHSSGLPDATLDPALLNDVRAGGDRRWTADDIIGYILDNPAVGAPGDRWKYSNVNNVLARLVLERVTGSTIDALLMTHVIEPMGLDGITLVTGREIPDLPPGVVRETNIFGIAPESLGGGSYPVDPRVVFAGGGVVAPAADLAVLARRLFAEERFEYATMREMLRFGRAGNDPGAGYGLGVERRASRLGIAYGHGGWVPGYMTETTYYTDYRFALTIHVPTTVGVSPRTLRGCLDGCARILADAMLTP